eukprot:TRINITY_DN1711_c0_g1_i1.p1 TRINITY_DN1711_c0_g1~~TRINITY_DN1711_c0_g1_i1.p1  ORF type:complete len:106 (+),score=35.29 TRINITY_DN1711_c0_g1_i1:111-428(+)
MGPRPDAADFCMISLTVGSAGPYYRFIVNAHDIFTDPILGLKFRATINGPHPAAVGTFTELGSYAQYDALYYCSFDGIYTGRIFLVDDDDDEHELIDSPFSVPSY